ncbi:MAG: hypothetical protein ACP5N7_01015 [Candidatus Pacearchaeota archaeon]
MLNNGEKIRLAKRHRCLHKQYLKAYRDKIFKEKMIEIPREDLINDLRFEIKTGDSATIKKKTHQTTIFENINKQSMIDLLTDNRDNIDIGQDDDLGLRMSQLL